MYKIAKVASLPPRIFPQYVSHPHNLLRSLCWPKPPQNILIVKKPWQDNVLQATKTFINHLHEAYPSVNIIVTEDVGNELHNTTTKPSTIKMDSEIHEDDENIPKIEPLDGTKIEPMSVNIPLYTGSVAEIVSRTDLLVSLGGDGTILRGVSLFSNTRVPPVLSFSLGTLGFLLPFDFTNYAAAFKQVFDSRSAVMKRDRIECHIIKKPQNTPDQIDALKKLSDTASDPSQIYQSNFKIHAMNDIVLHRGSLPGLLSLDIYINGHFLTRTTADGLIFSTPTGSTAYSLSSGGSIVHPLVKCILLTPICPRSLSFRPLVLPFNSHILVKVVGRHKIGTLEGKGKMSIDGIPQTRLLPGDEIHIISETTCSKTTPSATSSSEILGDGSGNDFKPLSAKDSGVWCVVHSKGDWVNGINSMLGFNLGFKSTKDKQNN